MIKILTLHLLYNEAADLSDPYELPHNVFEDIDIADYIQIGLIV